MIPRRQSLASPRIVTNCGPRSPIIRLRGKACCYQNTCRLVYPWHDTLAAAFADRNGFIPSSELWGILGILTQGRHCGLGGRQAEIMASLGFEPSQRRVNGKSSIRGYLRKGSDRRRSCHRDAHHFR